jgi:hypothetical protein
MTDGSSITGLSRITPDDTGASLGGRTGKPL